MVGVSTVQILFYVTFYITLTLADTYYYYLIPASLDPSGQTFDICRKPFAGAGTSAAGEGEGQVREVSGEEA